jgi:hypothetical protein
MLQKMQTRSSIFLSQLESFEAQITATRCRGNMSLPPKPLEIARTGKRLPAVIKVTPIKHRLLLATDVDLDPFNSDGWYILRYTGTHTNFRLANVELIGNIDELSPRCYSREPFWTRKPKPKPEKNIYWVQIWVPLTSPKVSRH